MFKVVFDETANKQYGGGSKPVSNENLLFCKYFKGISPILQSTRYPHLPNNILHNYPSGSHFVVEMNSEIATKQSQIF